MTETFWAWQKSQNTAEGGRFSLVLINQLFRDESSQSSVVSNKLVYRSFLLDF